MSWFFYTRLGQWLSILFSGWCLIRKDDQRFGFTSDDLALRYEGDPSAAPDRGIGNQRERWKDWVVFKMPESIGRRFVVIDTYKGDRLACFKENEKGIFAIRAGHEAGVIRIGARHPYSGARLQPEFLARWREDQSWPLEITKEDVLFI